MRTIGIVRARIKIGLQNFVYNVRQLATLAAWPPLEGGIRPPREKHEKRAASQTNAAPRSVLEIDEIEGHQQ